MLTPLRSDAAKGHSQPLRAVLTRPWVRHGVVAMPSRTLLFGNVVRARPVGLGLRRERASLDLVFTHWQDPAGELVPISAIPMHLDNAREQVTKPGRVQGILAARNPLGLARGIWYRPSPSLLFRTPSGLTGACGTAWSRLALGPVGAVSLLGARLLFTRLPDPEIHLPVGTELTLRMESVPPVGDWGSVAEPTPLEQRLAAFLGAQPVEVRRSDGRAVADTINVAFLGSEELLAEAFLAAGWVPAEPLNRKTFRRAYHAFTERKGYPTAPVSKLTYQGRAPGLVFQKSLNSLSKRHHIRLWKVAAPWGESIWLGAATHDVAMIFDRRQFTLSHRVDPQIDRERDKVHADLDFAGAVEELSVVAREIDAPDVETDGGLAVVRLRSPDARSVEVAHAAAPHRKPTAIRRVVRRVALETRHYLLRDNVYYVAFRAGSRWGSRR